VLTADYEESVSRVIRVIRVIRVMRGDAAAAALSYHVGTVFAARLFECPLDGQVRGRYGIVRMRPGKP
jgi:hypothetical protein